MAAETVGLVASVTALTTFGAKLSLALYEYAATVKGARSDVMTIGQEVSLSCAVLQQVRSALESDGAVRFSASATKTTSDIVDRCMGAFDEIDEVLNKAKKGDSGGSGGGDAPAMGLAQRVAWPYRRAKIRRLQGSLDAMRLTLHMMLTTLQLSNRVYSRRTSTTTLEETMAAEENDQVLCQSLVVAQRVSLENLQALEEEEAREAAAEPQSPPKEADTPASTPAGKKPEPKTPEIPELQPGPEKRVTIAMRPNATARTAADPSASAAGADLSITEDSVGKDGSAFLIEASSLCRLSPSTSMQSLIDEAKTQPYALAGRWTEDGRPSTPAVTSHQRTKSAPQQPTSTTRSALHRMPLGSPSARSNRTPDARVPAAATAQDLVLASLPQQPSNSTPYPTRSHMTTFERWNTLSAHWEALVSYWTRRLEQDRTEIEALPLTMQLARQVTDLSAAGANLFHAVVELQRLRASSERKFQRWFFETRAELERSKELVDAKEAALRQEQRTRQALDSEARMHKSSVEEMSRALQNERQLRLNVVQYLNQSGEADIERVFSGS